MLINILLLDKDKYFYKRIRNYFENFNFNIIFKINNNSIFEFINKNNIKIILVGYNLYSEKTYTLCKKLRRKYEISIIVLNHKKDLKILLKYFELGIDDYILRSILIKEFFVILKSKINQEKRWKRKIQNDFSTVTKFIKIKNQCLTNNNKSQKLTDTEYKILSYFLQNKNVIIDKEKLYKDIWEYKPIGNLNTLTVHINNLRKKIKKLNINKFKIKTIWGSGYKFTFRNDS
ncbi:MAG: response regulator transcription factor [Bacillota bacterium]